MDNGKDDIHPTYPRTPTQSSMIKSCVFAGAITGQLTMGLAGDMLGRRRAMLLTNSFSILGSLGTALFTWGPPSTVYGIMMAFRFLLGVGVGGKYPLAATTGRTRRMVKSVWNLPIPRRFLIPRKYTATRRTRRSCSTDQPSAFE